MLLYILYILEVFCYSVYLVDFVTCVSFVFCYSVYLVDFGTCVSFVLSYFLKLPFVFRPIFLSNCFYLFSYILSDTLLSPGNLRKVYKVNQPLLKIVNVNQ